MSQATPRRRATGAAELQPGVTAAIVDAVLDELAENGYGGLSMDTVARRARVGKAALYRRWNSKQDMTVDVVSRLSVEMAEARDEGSFRADIRAALAAVTRWLDDPRTGKIVMDLCTVALRNPAFADALTEHIGVPRRTLLGTIFERARERGDLLPNADLDLLLDMLGGIVHWRLIIRRERVDGRYLDEVTDVIVAAFAK